MNGTTLYGNNIIEYNEYLYDAAETKILYNEWENSFFDVMRAGIYNINLYAEADGEGGEKVGIFAKIGRFFSKMWKGFLKFIKTVCEKTLKILTLPFSKREKIAAGGSGGSSAGSNTERKSGSSGNSTDTSKAIGFGGTNVRAVYSMRTKILKYLSDGAANISNTIPTDVHPKVKALANKDEIYKIDDIKKLYSALDTEIEEIENNIDGLSSEDANDTDRVKKMNSIGTDNISKSYFSNVLNGESFELYASNLADALGDTSANFKEIDEFISYIGIVSGVIVGLAACARAVESGVNSIDAAKAKDKAITKALINIATEIGTVGTVKSASSGAYTNAMAIDLDSKYKVFGRPAKEILTNLPLLFIYASGKNVLNAFGEKVIDAIYNTTGTKRDTYGNIYKSYTSDLFSKQIMDMTLINDKYKQITIQSGDGNGTKLTNQLSNMVSYLATNNMEKEIKKSLNGVQVVTKAMQGDIEELTKVNDNNVKASDAMIEAMEKNSATIENDAIKDLVKMATTALRAIGTQGVGILNEFVRFQSAQEGAMLAYNLIGAANYLCNRIDRCRYIASFIKNIASDEAFLKERGIDKAEVLNVVKNLDSRITSYKAVLIKKTPTLL